MLLQVNYLSHHRSVDIGPLLSGMCAELATLGVNANHLLVKLDWVQYKQNFRPPLDAHLYLDDHTPLAERELSVDVRRITGEVDSEEIARSLRYLYMEQTNLDERVPLEEFGKPSQSVIWSFNRAFWQHLSTWEGVFHKGFLSALPGGQSDGMNPVFWRDRLAAFLDTLDDLRSRSLVPEEIYVLELGVGNGQQARVWLDTFRELCRERGSDYDRRVRYLMTDYSHDVLRTAREAVGEHGDQVSCLNFDVTDPQHALAFLRYKVLFIHSCNLYDNLPTDELCRRNGKLFEVQARAYLSRCDRDRLCETHHLNPDELPITIQRFLRIGPEYFDHIEAGVQFWADLWAAIRLEERYVQIEDPGRLRIAHGVPLDLVERVLEQTPGDIRMHLSTGAIQSFANTLPLLHPRGTFQVQDLFTTELDQYRHAFRGPGKLDGSIVNWVNGPLLAAVGEHLGYAVEFEPFTRYRERSNILTLTTSQKE